VKHELALLSLTVLPVTKKLGLLFRLEHIFASLLVEFQKR